MRSLLAVSVLLGLVACDGLEPLLNLCANPPKTPPKTLSDKMGLPDSYKISGSLTDWMTATSSLITESSTKEFRVLERKSRDAQTEKWIQSLTGEKLTMFVNASSGECDAKANKTNLIPDARFASILGSDTSSYYAIIQGLLRYLKDRNGFIIENDVEIIGGVNSAKWVSCIDGANATDNKVLLEVRYAGDNTIPPSQPAFSNPLLLSVRLAELPSFNSTVALKHVSIEIDRYELPTGNEAAIVHGVYCQNRNSTTLPLKSLDEYAAVLNYFDHGTNRSEVIEVLYSKSRQILVVAGDSFENGVKLLKSKHDRFRNGTDYILHDFKYGYEFTMSRGACESFSTLIAGTNDVILEGDPVENSTLSMNKMEFLLVDPSLRWDDYGDDVDMTGKPYKTYRAYDSRDETISELHLTEDGEVHSLATFRFGSRHLAVTMTVSKIPTESSRLNLKATQLSDCYDDGKYANNTWIVQIKDKNFLDMGKVGLNNLNNAVAESISKNVYPVIPYRIVVFYVENKDSGISVILRIVEKSEKQPAKVVGYNYTAELPTFDLFNLMNATMFLEKMPIEVEKVGGIKEEWVADANTMKMYPPDNDTGFLGYTGGAMFVLAIFCLLIGVSIGAVGVFVATRRQRISTLAYQVFE